MKLSIGYITGRFEPRIDWFLDALRMQMHHNDEFEVIVVDALHDRRPPEFAAANEKLSPCPIRHIPVKPNVWQGRHRLTKCDWFALSNARNTFVASARYDWLATLDDRMVICPGWLDSVRAACNSRYAVCGTYRKVVGLKPTPGVPVDFHKPPMDEELTNDPRSPAGMDHRLKLVRGYGIHACNGDWWFGGSFSESVEWATMVNGHCEDADGCSLNDVLYGMMMKNSGVHLKYNTQMAIVQDRTPALSGPVYTRTDKGISPNDKSHALLRRCAHLKKCNNPFGEMKELRQSILSGGTFPVIQEPTRDWYDGQPLADFPCPPEEGLKL